jgi:hypothetical protein
MGIGEGAMATRNRDLQVQWRGAAYPVEDAPGRDTHQPGGMGRVRPYVCHLDDREQAVWI